MQKQANTHAAAAGRLMTGVKSFVLASVCCLMFLLLLLAPNEGINGARNGLLLCSEVVVPSLFPFLVLSAFVINTGLAEKLGRLLEKPVRAIFRLPGSAAAALCLGIIGGYPVGAKACAELCKRGALKKNEAERMLIFCINSSPAFIIGAVGSGLLGSTQAGVLLYCAHVGASLILGIVSSLFVRRVRGPAAKARVKGDPVPEALVRASTGSAVSILNICAFVVLFSTLTALLADTDILAWAVRAINGFLHMQFIDASFFDRAVKGFLEVSNGCAAAVAQGGMTGILLISAVLSWSGLSVIFQIIYAVRDAGLSVKLYVLSRIPHVLISTMLTVALFNLFPVAIPAFASGTVRLAAAVHTAPASVALLVVCSLLLLSQVTV